MNIFETIVQEIGDYDGVAIIAGTRQIRYPQLFADTRALADRLQQCGVSPSARVGLLAADSYEYVVAALAVLSLQAALIPLSTRAAQSELAEMPQQVKLNFRIADATFATPEAIELQWGLSLQKLDSKRHPIALPEGKIPAFIRFSSGTTGANKGVVLSHTAVIERTDACTALGVRRGEKILWVLDMAFHFVVTILLFLRRGGCIVLCPTPVEAEMPRLLREHEFSLLYATPYHYRLLRYSAEVPAESLRQVRLALSTAMKLEAEDAAAFRQKFGIPLTQAYGIIEIGLPCVNTSANAGKINSVGRLQKAYELRIAEPDADGCGKIEIRGPGMFDAYLTPFCLRQTLCPDGFFATGDLGKLDADGFLSILGRSKNVIIFAGMKIFPYEVESVLNRHPWVAESRVSGQPMPGFGEIPVAEIVLKNGGAALPPDAFTTLRAYCFAQLAAYKVPKDFIFREALPKTASGKVMRR